MPHGHAAAPFPDSKRTLTGPLANAAFSRQRAGMQGGPTPHFASGVYCKYAAEKDLPLQVRFDARAFLCWWSQSPGRSQRQLSLCDHNGQVALRGKFNTICNTCALEVILRTGQATGDRIQAGDMATWERRSSAPGVEKCGGNAFIFTSAACITQAPTGRGSSIMRLCAP
jgi:hypothetical protein